MDAGRSDAGRAAASHTAAAATPTMTPRALFTQAGVIATRTIGELLDTAALLHSQPLPAGIRVGCGSNTGGAGVLAADVCTEAGLNAPELPADLVTELLELLPDRASAANPVDATAGARNPLARPAAGHGPRSVGGENTMAAETLVARYLEANPEATARSRDVFAVTFDQAVAAEHEGVAGGVARDGLGGNVFETGTQWWGSRLVPLAVVERVGKLPRRGCLLDSL